MRQKRGTPLHGWLVLDKPVGFSSNDAVRKVKGLLKPRKIGHAGTLDPLASGILPLGLGEATKTMPYLVDASKDYIFDVYFGTETSTGDTEGEIIETSNHSPSKEDILSVLSKFQGVIEQRPPAFSAIKVEGERAYKKARRGEEVELPVRRVNIEKLELMSQKGKKATFFVRCGKGTYIRSLAQDIARVLQSRGHVSRLRRTRVGPFEEKDAITLEMLEELGHSAPASQVIRPVETVLDDIPALAVTGHEADRISSGQTVHLVSEKEGTVRLMAGSTLVAIANLQKGKARPLRVFNLR